ncbi:MAG: M15 family metallopeptidase [Pseudomonadota bacterium]
MEARDIQMVLSAAGYYSGGIDGDIGKKSWNAITTVEQKHKKLYTFNPTKVPKKRRPVGATQACLHKLGFNPGKVDGHTGVNTSEALNAFLFKKVNGKAEIIKRKAIAKAPAPAEIPRQKDVEAVYGTPGDDIKKKLVTFKLPFKLRLDFALDKTTSRMTVHRDCADQLKKAMIEVHDHYGMKRMKDLGIDRYAGGYNHRTMRGGRKFSMHAYGCAVDFFAAPNGLRVRAPDALFSKPEYKDFLDIMEKNEWLPAIRLWGADAMHFQRARL